MFYKEIKKEEDNVIKWDFGVFGGFIDKVFKFLLCFVLEGILILYD